jgi:hypothetical protein
MKKYLLFSFLVYSLNSIGQSVTLLPSGQTEYRQDNTTYSGRVYSSGNNLRMNAFATSLLSSSSPGNLILQTNYTIPGPISIPFATGNVGIGVANPTNKLHLLGGSWDLTNAANGDFKIGNDTYSFRIGIATGGGGAGDIRMFARGGTNRFIWGTNGVDRMVLNGSGYLGIGTYDPVSKLQLAGNTTANSTMTILGSSAVPTIDFMRSQGTNSSPTLIANGSTLGRMEFQGYNGSDYTTQAYIRVLAAENWTSTARGTYILIGNTLNGSSTISENLRISNTGNIGIGTANTAGHKLNVNGIIRANEVVVQTGWADYVFENDYKLKDLKEVEQFITENKHLPDVPSAKNIQEKGAHVSELMTKMMAKIEELTLYTIQQQKEIEELKSKIK